MSNLFKKISAFVLTAIMVLTMCSSVFAGGTGTKPAEGDTATATVKNVETKAIVTAYQIVKADYNDYGFTGYETVDGVTLKDLYNPTSDEITSLAKDTTLLSRLKKASMTTSATEGLGDFTASLNAGTWLVLVTGGDEVYNPMIVSLAYDTKGTGDDNTLGTGTVDATKSWELKGTTVYAKSTAPSLEKTIVEPSSKNSKGDDVAYGDTVNYQIKTAIPSYSDQYTEVKVQVSDTLSEGLKLDTENVVVTVNGETVVSETDTYTINATESGFTIDFASAYALANSGKDVVVTYSATVTEDVPCNFDPSTNTGKLTYSNDPSNKENTKSVEDKTYHYTFAIDGSLYGTSEEEWNETTTEITKTGTKEEKTESNTLEIDNGPLSGAEFTLYESDGKTAVENADGTERTAESDANGQISFKGLDAGKYVIKETKAPNGYALNSNPIPVEITASYNEDGTLKDYSISIGKDNAKTFKYTAEYENKVVKNITTSTTIGTDTYEFINTPLNSLPSTGGMGTYIFTIVGVILMACAAGAFFISRKKSEN